MRIEIENGTCTKDTEAIALLTRAEEEYLAALAQKLVVRQEHKKAKEMEAQEKERIRVERQKEKERLKLEKQKEEERRRGAALDRCFPAGNGEDTIC